jgi:hypothetical protein
MKRIFTKEKQRTTKMTNRNTTALIRRPLAVFAYKILTITLGLTVLQAHAGLPLDDAELDTKFIEQKYSDSENALFSSVFNSVRLSGESDIFGIPAGVSNTGTPIPFGSENYSTKWAGNLDQIFRPTANASGVLAPYSVYDTSDIGFGFRAESHFAQEIRQSNIQLFIDRQ